MKIYSVIDRKAKMVCCTFVAPNDENAIRSFEDLITVPEDTVFTLHPEDFSLVKAFEVDDSTLFKLDSVIDGSSFSIAALAKNREKRIAFLRSISALSSGYEDTDIPGGDEDGNK